MGCGARATPAPAGCGCPYSLKGLLRTRSLASLSLKALWQGRLSNGRRGGEGEQHSPVMPALLLLFYFSASGVGSCSEKEQSRIPRVKGGRASLP